MRKNVLRVISLLLTGAFIGGIGMGCGNDSNNKGKDTEARKVYDTLGIDEIAVGMWVTPPEDFRNDEYYAQMRECGINFINGFEYFESGESAIKEALTLAENNDMKFLVADSAVTESINAYKASGDPGVIADAMDRIERYYDYPAYAGQLLVDEPGRSLFSVVNDFVKAYEANYPGKRWHVNMFPSYATGGTGVPYEQYVDDWLAMAEPDYYSYDSYPFLKYDPDGYKPRPEMEDYYYNLDILRAKTREKEIPLWTFVQTLQFSGTPGVPDHRMPSREDIRWQVFTNLAFGAKGLQYFCYWSPGSGLETFSDALVSQSGEPTERYDYVKELNAEFHDYGKLLLGCHADGVILHGAPDEKRYELYEDSLTSFGSVTSVSGDMFLAGCFTDAESGKKSMLITPTTPRDSAEVTLNVGGGKKQVTAYIAGVREEIPVSGGKVVFNIEKGDAVYVIL